jgi:hypothetical protein
MIPMFIFENWYATVIQRAYRNYKKPESYGTPDEKFLGIIHRDGKDFYFINGKLMEANKVIT